MFRECFFEYAGRSSQPYNLMLCYVSNTNTDFDSGGKFDLKTDTLPCSHEALLYGKDYSAQPLSFEVEFVNIDENIPLQQMIEIKNWLFDQDGWKTFRLLDEMQDYRLKCIFEPGEDIVDGGGYRGLRCTLKNVSPFWYGVESSITIPCDQFDASQKVEAFNSTFAAFNIEIPRCDEVDSDIMPIIEFTIDATEFADYDDPMWIQLCRLGVDNISDAIALDGENNFTAEIIGCVALSLNGYATQSSAHDIIRVSTKYGYIYPDNYNVSDIFWNISNGHALSQGNSSLIYFNYGTNICRINLSDSLKSITLKYTPVYRMGAF